MTIKGTVNSVVYYNSENGYTVLNLDIEGGSNITVVGNLPSLAVGEVLEVTGELVFHQRYGEQLIAESYKTSNPTTKDGIIKYLSSGLIKGVGVVTATAIFKAFGQDTLGVIESNPEKLATVKGISKKKAMDIYNSISELKIMQEQIMFLQQYEITTNLALKIYNIYKSGTKSLVSTNPYKLVDDIDGVGFATADKIALSMGHSTVGEFRIRSALIYCLKDSAEKLGNTYLPLDALLDLASNLLGINLYEIEILEEILSKMALEPVIRIFDLDSTRCASLIWLYRTEQSIATQLLKINKDASKSQIDSQVLVKHFEELNKIEFHKSQLSAVFSAVTNGVTVITGGPGTGKTTIINCIVNCFTTNGLRVELCAPTGRAAKRLSESTGREAKTIHRMLGYEFKDGRMSFKFKQHNTLPCDVVIVDEVSMIDVNLMSSLLKAIEPGTRLILVGDKDQLPSVGAGNVLADIIRSKIIDVRYLTHIYRQSEGSLIVTNAHLINQGKMPEIDNKSQDFFVMNFDNAEVIAQKVVELVQTRLPKYTKLDNSDIQVLTALKSGAAGVNNLNALLQDAINKKTPLKKEIRIGTHTFRVGDRVMQTVNDYELPYYKIDTLGNTTEGQGIFNGDIGYIKSIDNSGLVEVIFDDNRIGQYTTHDLINLQLAYTITIHKSQGSEFPVVVIPLVGGPPTIINKNLLYTAITRAKNMVVLVGSKKVMSLMIRNNYISKRLTLLEKFLCDEKLRFDKFFG